MAFPGLEVVGTERGVLIGRHLGIGKAAHMTPLFLQPLRIPVADSIVHHLKYPHLPETGDVAIFQP